MYSIQLNENKNKTPAPPLAPTYGSKGTGYAQNGVLTDASDNNVAQGKQKVKGQYSQKQSEDAFLESAPVVEAFVKEETQNSLKGQEQVYIDHEKLVSDLQQIRETAKAEGISEADLRERIDRRVSIDYQKMVDAYGTLKPGEKPVREAQVPKQTDKNRKVSQTVRTIMEAGATPDIALSNIKELVATGEFSYETLTDKAAMEAFTIYYVLFLQILQNLLNG